MKNLLNIILFLAGLFIISQMSGFIFNNPVTSKIELMRALIFGGISAIISSFPVIIHDSCKNFRRI